MTIQLVNESFNPWALLDAYQQGMPAGEHGAASVFVGSMRDSNQGDAVQAMWLEHYPGMTEQQLQKIQTEAEQQWALLDVLIVHRVGAVLPADSLVVVAVWSKHRGDAFDASRFIMEALKSRAPFWKKERLADGSERWVESNSGGYANKPVAG
jgi:molybdopterin synthase catalytic subunit